MNDVDKGIGAPSAVSGIETKSRPIDEQVTLLIPTLGRDMILGSLRSVLEGRRWPGRIVIVDQGQSDNISTWLKQITTLGIETLHLPSVEVGRSRALNRGLERIDSRFVVITDDDCRVAEDWIERLGEHLRESPDYVFTGRIEAGGHEPVLAKVLHDEPCVASKPGLAFDRLSGGNLGVAMGVFRRVGLFDEDPCVAFSEDGEWAYRALRSGVRIAYVPDAIVTHLGWRSRDERERQYAGYARSHAAFFGKHIRRGDGFIVLRAVVHLARACRRWLTGLISADREQTAYGRAYLRYFVPGILAGLKSSNEPPSLLGVPGKTGREP
ncbi:MAG: glycosyltransferase [Gammaproteobacteria bacterium]|nr:glycosyltransferase [Gammaproteobacteria bacterium]